MLIQSIGRDHRAAGRRAASANDDDDDDYYCYYYDSGPRAAKCVCGRNNFISPLASQPAGRPDDQQASSIAGQNFKLPLN